MILFRLLATIVAVFGFWEGLSVVTWFSNQPSDLAIVSGAILAILLLAALWYVLTLTWRFLWED